MKLYEVGNNLIEQRRNQGSEKSQSLSEKGDEICTQVWLTGEPSTHCHITLPGSVPGKWSLVTYWRELAGPLACSEILQHRVFFSFGGNKALYSLFH